MTWRQRFAFLSLAVGMVTTFLSQQASAQPCAVVADPPVSLGGVGSAADIAVNHLTGQPAIAWVGDDNKIYLSTNDGIDWSAPQLVDTGGIIPIIHVPDAPYLPFALKGLALAINSYGELHIIIGTADHLYHFENTGSGWSAPEILADAVDPGSSDPHYEVLADFDSQDVLHVGWAINQGLEAEGLGLYYANRTSSGWSAPFYIARGPHIDMHVEPNGRVHVASMRYHPPVGEWRNYQGHYRQRALDGTWGPDEQATDEDPVGTIGPVAIHPTVAVGPDGRIHMGYPVDPPNPTGGFQEDGHASYIQRTGTGWSAPQELFPNGTHAAYVQTVVDPAGVLYIVGVNWNKRYRVDLGSGFTPVDFWETPTARWFSVRTKAAPSGAWIAYSFGRNTGPIQAVHLRRTGDCGAFCGDGVCGPSEDACTCLYDCTNQCCIEGVAYGQGVANPTDPCLVCDPLAHRRFWTSDPTAPGCVSPDAGVDAGSDLDAGSGPDASPDLDATPDQDASPGQDADPGDHSSVRTGCGCQGAPGDSSVLWLLFLALLPLGRSRCNGDPLQLFRSGGVCRLGRRPQH